MSSSLNSLNTLISVFQHDEEKTAPVPYDAADIETNIVYSRDTGQRFVVDMNKMKFVISNISVKHKVLNARTTNPQCTLQTHGFQLLSSQHTKLSTNDFYTNPHDIIATRYYSEIECAVQHLLGAEHVVATSHQVRCAETEKAPKSATVDVQPAAHAAHCDYSAFGGFQMYQAALRKLKASKRVKDKQELERFTAGRFALINAWRNISDTQPIYDDHLAVCDGRSVVAPDDFLKYDYLAAGVKAEAYYLSDQHQQVHQWYYYPRMRKDELLLFMQYDSDYRAQSRYGFHSAVKDPTAKSGCPPRQSIELRLVAFFPNHEPNTIPEYKPAAFSVDAAVDGLMNAVKSAQYWPQDAKQSMAEKIRNAEIKEVIAWLVEGSRAGGYHGLSDASEQQIEMVIAALMQKKDEFKAAAMKNFPLSK